MTTGDTAGARIGTIDAVRGFAVCGILVMNIVGMGMPAYAYADPFYYGGAHGWDLFAWGAAYVLADGKMRALFTMLFGASMMLIADRAEARGEGAVGIHYRRMAWLFLFGMAHAWLLWFGDILVLYAIAGGIVFVAWRWPTLALIFAVAVLFAATFAGDLLQWHDLSALRAAALAPHAPADAIKAWRDIAVAASPADPAIVQQLHLYRGGIADVFAARAASTRLLQTVVIPDTLPETLGYMLFGMLLFRLGFLSGRRPARLYWTLIAIGYGIAVPLMLPVAWLLLRTRFDPATMPLADALSFALRPAIALAHASAVILLARSGRLAGLVNRLAAAGRMALSNYLGTSILTTTLFYGYGLGLYGRLGRAELYLVVLAVWALILFWSRPWLTRFRYGPFEWLWRSLARWKIQPFIRR